MKVFNVLLYKRHKNINAATEEMKPQTWELLVKSKLTPIDKKGNYNKDFVYCKAEEVDKWFDLGDLGGSAEDQEAQLKREMAEMQKKLDMINRQKGLNVEKDAPAPPADKPTKDVKEEDEGIDIFAMDEEALRSLAKEQGIALGNTKDLDKIKNKIYEALKPDNND